jgi:hypothetical protein
LEGKVLQRGGHPKLILVRKSSKYSTSKIDDLLWQSKHHSGTLGKLPELEVVPSWEQSWAKVTVQGMPLKSYLILNYILHVEQPQSDNPKIKIQNILSTNMTLLVGNSTP